MKCYVYYKDGTMKDFRPLNPNYEPTSVLTRAAVVDDSDTIRKELIDGTIEDNKGKAFVAMQLRSVDDGKVIYSRSTDESLAKKKCSMSKRIESFKKNEAEDDKETAFFNALDKLGFVQRNDYDDPHFKVYYVDYPTGFGKIAVTAGRAYINNDHPNLYNVSFGVRTTNKNSTIASYTRDINEEGALQDLVEMVYTYLAMQKKLANLPNNE